MEVRGALALHLRSCHEKRRRFREIQVSSTAYLERKSIETCDPPRGAFAPSKVPSARSQDQLRRKRTPPVELGSDGLGLDAMAEAGGRAGGRNRARAARDWAPRPVTSSGDQR